MATTPFAFQADAGQTLSVIFQADGGTGTPAASYSATELATAKGWYSIDITQALDGTFFWHAQDGSSNIVANGVADLEDNTTRHFGYDPVSATGYEGSGGGGSAPTAAAIADAVWDEATADHTTAGSFGEAIGDIAGFDGSDFTAIPWNSAWDTEVQSEVTDALTAYNAMATTDIVSAAAIADAVWDEAAGDHTTAGTFGEAIGDIAAFDGSDFTSIPWNSAWDAEVQSEVADALTAYNAMATTDIVSAGTIADAVWDEATADHTASGSFGELMATINTTTDSTLTTLGTLSTSSSAISVVADSFTLTTGSQTGTSANTEQLDGVYHQISDDANTTDFYYEFDVGPNGVPVSVRWDGYAQANNDTYNFFFYNWADTSWDQVGSIAGSNGTNLRSETFSATIAHVGSGSDDGKVRWRVQSSNGNEFYSDRVLCDYTIVELSLGYDQSAVWVDETSGTSTGTTPGIDGLVTNRSDDFDNAQDIADALGYSRIMVSSGNSITLSDDIENFLIGSEESNFQLNLGTNTSINGSTIMGCNIIGGSATATFCRFSYGSMTNCTIPPCFVSYVSVTSVTLGTAGNYTFTNSGSGIAGPSAPTIAMPGSGTTNLALRRWVGGITLNGLTSGDTVTIDGTLGTVTLNGADATVEVRGTYKKIVNNLTGSPSVNVEGGLQGASLGYSLGAVWVDTDNGTSEGTLAGIDGLVTNRSDTFNNAQSIASTLGYNKVSVSNGNSITLDQSISDFTLTGTVWSLALGGQALNDCTIDGAAVSGISSGQNLIWYNCDFNASTIPTSVVVDSGINSTMTLDGNGNYQFINCYDSIAGLGRPTFDFTNIDGATSIIIRGWKGGIILDNVNTNCTIALDGVFGTVTIEGADGSVNLNGTYKTIIDNRTGSPTLSTTGAIKAEDVSVTKDQATIAAQNVQS